MGLVRRGRYAIHDVITRVIMVYYDVYGSRHLGCVYFGAHPAPHVYRCKNRDDQGLAGSAGGWWPTAWGTHGCGASRDQIDGIVEKRMK